MWEGDAVTHRLLPLQQKKMAPIRRSNSTTIEMLECNTNSSVHVHMPMVPVLDLKIVTLQHFHGCTPYRSIDISGYNF